MNFFKLYMGDYQRDTGALSIAEHGAYFLMLQYHYATEKPLPTGKDLYRLLRCESKADREAVDAVAKLYWTETPEGLVNARAAQEIAKAGEQAETNRRIAQAREDKRKAERKAERTAHEPLHEPCSVREPSHSHSQIKEKTKTSADAPLPDWIPQDAWNSYVEMRKKIRKAPTPRAAELVIAKLLKLRNEGHPPAAVLEQSIVNSWQDVFPLRAGASVSSSLVKRAAV